MVRGFLAGAAFVGAVCILTVVSGIEQPTLVDEVALDVFDDHCDSSEAECDFSLRQLRARSIQKHSFETGSSVKRTQKVLLQSTISIAKPATLSLAMLDLRPSPEIAGFSEISAGCNSLALKLSSECAPDDPESMTSKDISMMCSCKEIIEDLYDNCPQYKTKLEKWHMQYQAMCSSCGEPMTELVYTKGCMDDSTESGLNESALCSDTCHSHLCEVVAACEVKGSKAPGSSVENTAIAISYMKKDLEAHSCSDCAAASLSQISASSIQNKVMTSSSMSRVVSQALLNVGSAISAESSKSCDALARKVSSECVPSDMNNLVGKDITRMCSCSDTIEKIHSDCPQYASSLASWYSDFQSMCSTCGEPFSVLIETKECIDHSSSTGLNEAADCGATCHPLLCETVSGCQAEGSKAPGNTAADTAVFVSALKKELDDQGCAGCEKASLGQVSAGTVQKSIAEHTEKHKEITRAMQDLNLLALSDISSSCDALALKLHSECVPADSDNIVPGDVTKMCDCKDTIQSLHDDCPQFASSMSSFYGDYLTMCSTCGEPFSIMIETKECMDASSSTGLKESAVCDATCHPLFCKTVSACNAEGSKAPGDSESDTARVMKVIKQELDDKGCSDCAASFGQVSVTSMQKQVLAIAQKETRLVKVSHALMGATFTMGSTKSSSSCNLLVKKVRTQCVPSDPSNLGPSDVTKMCGCQDVLQQIHDECPQYTTKMAGFYSQYQSMCSPCGEPFTILVETKECLDKSSSNGLAASAMCGSTCHPLLCQAISGCQADGSKAPGNTAANTAKFIAALQQDLDAKGCDDCATASFEQLSVGTTQNNFLAAATKPSVVSKNLLDMTLLALSKEVKPSCAALTLKLRTECVPGDGNNLTPQDIKTMCSCQNTIQSIHDDCPQYAKSLNSFYDDYKSMCSACGEPFSELIETKQCMDDSSPTGLKETAMCDETCHPLLCKTVSSCQAEGSKTPGGSAADTALFVAALKQDLDDKNCAACAASM